MPYQMKRNSYSWAILALLCGQFASLAKMTPEQTAKLPTPALHSVNFSSEIKPILEASCMKCHGRGKSKGGFSIETRETFLKGGDTGAAIVSGRSEESLMIELVMGFDPDSVMPKKGSKLKPEQIALLRAWIDQGAKWDGGVTFGKLPPQNLQPANPALPAGADAFVSRNSIDMILEGHFAKHGLKPGEPVDDRVFARRVYLDAIGMLPTPDELAGFLSDPATDKRNLLVRRLLADNQRYAEHWLTFWNDLLRNDYKGTGYIDNGRKQITGWLYEALATNMRYDRFVRELIDPNSESEGFAKGILWRGTVNASQTPPIQAAQNISQVFMGVNLKCASCHDSFINDWTLADAYGLANIYADEPLEMVHCDKPTGLKAVSQFIYPELGGIDGNLPKAERTRRLAEIMTQRQNARLTRTVVNRLWARFMGRGLVEPVDDMERPAWSPELLDWLATDLTENRYNLKKTIERILTSQAYQLAATPATEQGKDYVFRGPLVRRLSAEQYLDALSSITGVWQAKPEAQVDFLAGTPGALTRFAVPVRWVWNSQNAAEKAEPATVYFRKAISLAEMPASALIVVSCDNSYVLHINGKEAGSGRDHTKPNLIDIRKHLVKGTNVIAIAAVNDLAAPDKKESPQTSPAGLICYARIRTEPAGARPSLEVLDFASNASWRWSTNKMDNWTKADFDASSWPNALELGDSDAAPWKLGKKFAQVLSGAARQGLTRASLVSADSLMLALGRPNREQVMTTRATIATTLQALELTNGQTLAEDLKKGAETLLQSAAKSTDDLVGLTYTRALSRSPTPGEARLGAELVGTPAMREGVEDLLWAVAMLPEFQLIY
ncbi:MAG: DUF1549 domain-containing protein [Pedosphaera sp.]|nr:DUF1549 domain-containing protein [Pedosphaera sp.]